MNIVDNTIFNIALFSSSYLIILMIVSPIIDHIFTTLDDDKKLKENNFQILGEIILHLIIISIVWYLLNTYLVILLEGILNIKIKEATKSTVVIVGSIALVGLQKNLIEKLKYITLTHPFRMKDLYG